MKVNPLPPQAYTKETLQKAYTWLLNQSASVKDMASTQDMLISLYLKAQRSGEASLETPSIQNFKQELKNLASMIGELQTPNPPQAPSPSAPTHPHTHQSASTPPLISNGVMQQSSSQHATPQAPPQHYAPIHQPFQASPPANQIPTNSGSLMPSPQPKVTQQSTNTAGSGSNASSNASLGQLDLQSLQILSDVKNSLNLSSEIEVLRMLISLGYKQIKKMN